MGDETLEMRGVMEKEGVRPWSQPLAWEVQGGSVHHFENRCGGSTNGRHPQLFKVSFLALQTLATELRSAMDACLEGCESALCDHLLEVLAGCTTAGFLSRNKICISKPNAAVNPH